MPNIFGTIDGAYILLIQYLSKKITFVMNDFFKFHNFVMQVVCDMNIMFWTVCVGQPKLEVHDVGSLGIQIFTKH